ncbi:MAG: NAD(P)/FAD-dependent oxidoreductase [Dehalococcoidia bacterium]|nr:NAD(P)/FAD-dependent oxidoreductase [Dehalococcoidia bacterium]
MRKKVLIIGGGFGGLATVRALKNADVDITLIDRTNHHLFQPLLYQVASASLSPGDVAVPIREVLRRQKNVRAVLGEATGIDTTARCVKVDDSIYDYDYLVVAVGAQTCYYGHAEWERYAPGLKTISDAIRIRENILTSFEKAEVTEDERERCKQMTFVVVGAGPVGVEMAGAIAELAKNCMCSDFRRINTSQARVILIEALDRILLAFDPRLSEKARQALEKMGVEVRLKSKITHIDDKGVWLGEELISTANVVWSAGISAPALTKSLGAETDRLGRVCVNPDLSIPGCPEAFVIGDASFSLSDGKPLPALAPVAIQQGKYVSTLIRTELPAGGRMPFVYHDKGFMAIIGRAKAVVQRGGFKLSGFWAWCAFLVVHVAVLVQFRNRYAVTAEWLWYYLGNRPGVRLVTGHQNPQDKGT